MTTDDKLPFRQQYEASEIERDAYALVHAGFSAVRAAESIQTYGFDIAESQALPHSVRVPSSPTDVDDALSWLRARRERRDRTGVSPYADVLNELREGILERSPDLQGEAAIGYDDAAWREMRLTAAELGIEIVGEEDQFRGRADGPALRGAFIKRLVNERRRFAIVDPLDGSNQAAGMGQRSGWACCAMVYDSALSDVGAAILLGDGRGVVTAGSNGVWLSESYHPDRPAVAYKLNPFDRDRPVFARTHWIIPASKAPTIEHAERMIVASRPSADQEPAISWVSPLGGNPGFVAGLLCAGAVAAVQPESYAWDQMGPYLCAVAGLPTISRTSEDPISADALASLLLQDLAAGRTTQALYSGRTLDDARLLRSIDILTDAEQSWPT